MEGERSLVVFGSNKAWVVSEASLYTAIVSLSILDPVRGFLKLVLPASSVRALSSGQKDIPSSSTMFVEVASLIFLGKVINTAESSSALCDMARGLFDQTFCLERFLYIDFGHSLSFDV